jgi:hypothetical protein
VKVVVAAVAASKPTRSAELWSPVVDMKSRGAAGGDLHTSWHKGEHGSRKAIAAAVRPLLKPVEEEDGGGGSGPAATCQTEEWGSSAVSRRSADSDTAAAGTGGSSSAHHG